jgi:DNA polymerase III subunit epsilon
MFFAIVLLAVGLLIAIYVNLANKKGLSPPPSSKPDDFIEKMRIKIIEEDDPYGIKTDKDQIDEEIEGLLNREWKSGEPYLIIADVETSGLIKYRNPDRKALQNWPRIVQIAYQVFDFDHNELERVSVIFKQPRPLPPESIEIHGITDQMCKELGVKPEPILEKLYIYSKEARFFVAHNVDFDHDVIEANMRRFEIGHDFEMERLCTMVSSRKLRGFKPLNSLGNRKDANLAELHQHLFGFAPEKLHDAEADMLAASRCYFELKRRGLII